MKTGVELISDERQRQIEKEGWTAEHDDKQSYGHLALAGSCYALDCAGYDKTAWELWPWDRKWWKPATIATIPETIKELTKAGALIAAEIDRMQRVWEFQKKHGIYPNRDRNL